MSRETAERSDKPRHTAAERLRYWLVEERRLLLAAVGGLTEDAAREPLAADGWSVHDVLAHRMFWEGREAEALGKYLLGQRVELLDFPVKRIDGTNAAAVDTLRGHSTARILRELARTREALLQLAAKVPDAALNDEQDEARILLGVALEHDREHRRQIEAWRKRRARKSVERSSEPAP